MDHWSICRRTLVQRAMPEDPWPQMGIAAACGQLNHQEMARAAIELVRRHQPLYLDLKY